MLSIPLKPASFGGALLNLYNIDHCQSHKLTLATLLLYKWLKFFLPPRYSYITVYTLFLVSSFSTLVPK